MNPTTGQSDSLDITALVCVYNGLPDIEDLLKSILAQETGQQFTYEVLVVDNNSTDGTRDLLEQYAARYMDLLRVIEEKRQGLSYALNTGLQAARGAICFTIDDDLVAPKGCLRGVWEAFRVHPEVSFLGGKVLPIWPGPVPSWLTSDHWSPVAICDYGDMPRRVDANAQICLLTGSFLRSDLLAVGGYRTELGLRPGQLGGVEDVDVYTRLVRAGRCGIYVPEVVVYHKIDAQKLTKKYHRKWHTGHGRYYADMRLPSYEQSHLRIFDVPGHIYRQAAVGTLKWFNQTLRGDRDHAFSHELQVRFCFGFVRQRWGF
jgi:glycosyltransferase involved in cell wall biosynthesis